MQVYFAPPCKSSLRISEKSRAVHSTDCNTAAFCIAAATSGAAAAGRPSAKRPSVRCGRKARVSSLRPRARAAASTARWSLFRGVISPRSPTHSAPLRKAPRCSKCQLDGRKRSRHRPQIGSQGLSLLAGNLAQKLYGEVNVIGRHPAQAVPGKSCAQLRTNTAQ